MENEQSVEEVFLELTPEQEAEMLVDEFGDFAASIELCINEIPTERADVKNKVLKLTQALRDIDKDEMKVVFIAMEAAHQKLVPELPVGEGDE